MIPSELVEQLQKIIPINLASDIVRIFLQIRSDLSTETLERSAPGKFVETVVQILQFLESKQYEEAPKVDEYLRHLESRNSVLADDLRITLTRVARTTYTLRNKRNIAHKGGINPNIYDLRFLYVCTQWMFTEIVRNLLLTDMNTAADIIEYINVPINPLVEDFGDKRVVLMTSTAEEELLILLLHYFPEPILLSQIQKDMDRRAKSTILNVVSTTYSKRFVEGDKQKGYKLTSLGYSQAVKIVKSKI